MEIAAIYLLHFVTFGVAAEFVKTCNIIDYGAKDDHQTDNTKFIQSAIDDCSKVIPDLGAAPGNTSNEHRVACIRAGEIDLE